MKAVGERLKDKRVLVTGGSRGIGRAIVEALAQEGSKVAFTYASRPESAEEVLNSLPGQGHMCLQMDISQPESVEQVFAQVLESFGGLDGLVNNAGVTKDQLLLRMKDEDFDWVVNTNLKGTFLCSKAAIKPMMKARSGSIVNITSVIAHSGNPGQVNYAASKAGIEGMTRSMALELASRSLRLNCVAPGFIATDMTDSLTEEQKNKIAERIPLSRLGTGQDVAQAVVYLLSEESSYLTGQVLHVNGGLYM